MPRRSVLAILLCLLTGGILQALCASFLAIRSPITDRSGYDSGTLLSLYRNPAGELTDWASPNSKLEAGALSAALDMWPWLNRSSRDYQQFAVQYWQGFGAAFATGFADDYGVLEADGVTRKREWLQRYFAGWPMHSMHADVSRGDAIHSDLPRSGAIRGGVSVPESWVESDRAAIIVNWQQPTWQPVVPLRPRVLGTIVNSIVFSLPFLVPVAAIWWRAERRRRRGLCEYCGYSRAGFPTPASPCPECGRPAS